MALKVEVEQVGPVPVIRAEGEVDLYSSPELRKELKKQIKARTNLVVIDLSGVEYMDSSGVATLIEGLQGLGKVGGHLCLAGLNDSVMQVLKFVHLDKVFDIVPEVAEALKK